MAVFGLQRAPGARVVDAVLALLIWGAVVALAQPGVTLGPTDGAAPDFALESNEQILEALARLRG